MAKAPADSKCSSALQHLIESSLERDDSGPRRVYRDVPGNEYYSVTSIISSTDPESKRKSLEKWLKMPGAADTQKNAAARGTLAHANVEYIAKTARTLSKNAASKRGVWSLGTDMLERAPQDITK